MSSEDLQSEIERLTAAVTAAAASKKPLRRPRQVRLRIEALEAEVAAQIQPVLLDFWEELLILFRCCTRSNPQDTHKRLNRMRARYIKREKMADFETFFDVIKAILAPDFITPHGDNKPFSSINSDDVFDGLANHLSPILSRDEPVIMYAGTLLGYVRDGRPIEHDDDIDVAVYLGDHPPEDIPAIWLRYKQQLVDAGVIFPKWAAWHTPVIKLVGDDDVTIDLFPCWSHEGMFSVYPYSCGDLPMDAVFPLTNFKSGPVRLPADTDAFLKQCYGDTWRIPDPLFHFNWRRANRKFRLLKSQNYSIK